MTRLKIFPKVTFLRFGVFASTLISITLGYNLLAGDQHYFLTGETTHGHYQIELACSSCHSTRFPNADDFQTSCESCHAKELDRFSDTHPKKKFLDPRNADTLAALDARYCVTCHTEHKPEATRANGVTLAEDFCFHCHRGIAEERPSHQDFKFDSCADSGCHNYHDNSALYEKFFSKHLNEPWLSEQPQLRQRNLALRWLKKNKKVESLTKAQHDGSLIPNFRPILVEQWSQSFHATAAVNCSDCHQHEKNNENFNISSCQTCHSKIYQQFAAGHHGMTQQVNLPPMSTADARRPMSEQHRDVTCSSCHDPHLPDLIEAAVDSCLGCHQDKHSLNYKASPHYALWLAEIEHSAPQGSGVSCATCHIPRLRKGKKILVQHNQNANLSPNSKMLRTVCMNCHGMEFSVNSLADQLLIRDNFTGRPKQSISSFEMVKQRVKHKDQKRIKLQSKEN